jgi:hypothetical protein
MAVTDAHEGHGTATLSLSEETADGGQVFQSWAVCACTLGRFRERLGPAQHESYSTPEAVRGIGEAVLNQPGSIQVR